MSPADDRAGADAAAPTAANRERTLRAQGLPWQVCSPPAHLADAHGRYASPEVWSSLEITCHDEKDLKLMRGWLVDLGDGECQRIFAAQNAAFDNDSTARQA